MMRECYFTIKMQLKCSKTFPVDQDIVYVYVRGGGEFNRSNKKKSSQYSTSRKAKQNIKILFNCRK